VLKAINDQLAAIADRQREQFDMLSATLIDVLSDLDHIKTQVAGRKVGRRGVHRNTKASKP
jgi:hypothetical protein